MADSEDAPTDLSWPKKGQVLLSSANDWYHNACINLRYFNWDWYATGYKHAGDVLVQHVVDTRNYRDTLVFPIVLNYRQYLEVRCKEIIMLGKLLANEEPEFPNKHNLRLLWDTCRHLIETHESSASQTDLEAPEACARYAGRGQELESEAGSGSSTLFVIYPTSFGC